MFFHQYYSGIFNYAKKAIFKNLSLANVNINIDACEGGATVHPLVLFSAENCKFDKIKATTTVSGHANAAGLAEEVQGDPSKATLTKCWTYSSKYKRLVLKNNKEK